MIHLPIYWWPLGMGKLVMWAFMLRRKLGALKVFVLRWRIRRGAIVNLMRGISYPADYLFNQLTAIGFVDVEICVFRTKSNEDAHQFLLARVK